MGEKSRRGRTTKDAILGASDAGKQTIPEGQQSEPSVTAQTAAGNATTLAADTPSETQTTVSQTSGQVDIDTPLAPGAEITPLTGQPRPLNLADIVEKITPKGKSEDELEAEAKKYRRRQIISAVGEGLSALSNLYFTTRGAPTMYKPTGTIERNRKEYEKMLADDKTLKDNARNAYINAAKYDSNALLNWQKQQEEAKKAADELAWKKEQAAKQEAEREEAAKQKKEAQDQADRLAREKFKQDAGYKQRQLDLKERELALQERGGGTGSSRSNGSGSGSSNRKRIGFSDGQGNQMGIHESVWKGSMQQVYNLLLEDLAPAENVASWKRKMANKTASQKEDYVKQHWHESQRASQLMYILSEINPDTMESSLNDDVEDYDPDDEVIDWEPGN